MCYLLADKPLLIAGSSAGAGSGEFHVYRHLRRREYQRQDFMDAMAEKVSRTLYFFSHKHLVSTAIFFSL